MIALGAGLAGVVFLWARMRYGLLPAAIALGLCVLAPDLLAHGPLVTTDVGIALFFFLSVIALERFRNGLTLGRVAGLAGAVALAAAAKYSAVLLVPILSVLGIVMVRGRITRRGLVQAAAIAVILVAAVWVVLWACCGFRYASSPDPAASPLEWDRVLSASGVLRPLAVAGREHRLLPEALLFGFLRFYKASEDRPSFLLGEVSPTGWWYYFPVTFAIKTPLPLLLLLLGAAVVIWRRPAHPLRDPFLWLPPLLYMAIVMTRSLNIGHRHLLPIYPYLYVSAGLAAAAALRHHRMAVRAGCGLLLLWYAAGTLRVHPHHLAYFNELVGGPQNGYRCLVDSNLDWGQDLPALRRWLDEFGSGTASLKLSYFGSADPQYYGIRGERLPGHLRPARLAGRVLAGDIVAISATNLQAVYLSGAARDFMRVFQAEEPLARAGHSILIYRARQDYDVPQEAPTGDN
jgi:4-amino-4-deoxy-L-arabinose transferase-like glycosyltransferase